MTNNLTYREITFIGLLITNWVAFERSSPISGGKIRQEVAIVESNQYIQVTVCNFDKQKDYTNKFCLTNNILVQSDIINIEDKNIRDYKPTFTFYITNRESSGIYWHRTTN